MPYGTTPGFDQPASSDVQSLQSMMGRQQQANIQATGEQQRLTQAQENWTPISPDQMSNWHPSTQAFAQGAGRPNPDGSFSVRTDLLPKLLEHDTAMHTRDLKVAQETDMAQRLDRSFVDPKTGLPDYSGAPNIGVMRSMLGKGLMDDKTTEQLLNTLNAREMLKGQLSGDKDPIFGDITERSVDSTGKATIKTQKATAADIQSRSADLVYKLQAKVRGGEQLTPEEQNILARANAQLNLKPIQLGPGGTLLGKGDIIGGPGAGLNGPGAPQAAVPGALAYNPGPAPEGTGDKYIAASYATQEMSNLANELEQLPRDVSNRINETWRYEVQNRLPFGAGQALGLLSPQEQDISTRLRHAQIRYEQAVSGIRGAGSPQMYDRFQNIVGQFYGANTPQALRGLASSMNDYMAVVRQYEASQGRRSMPPAAVAPMPPRSSLSSTPTIAQPSGPPQSPSPQTINSQSATGTGFTAWKQKQGR